jgi:hypothetical protein
MQQHRCAVQPTVAKSRHAQLVLALLLHLLYCSQVEGVNTTSVVDCASLSGLTVYAVSAVLVYLYIIGIPQVTRHLAELSLRGFSAGGSALQSFNQAKYEAVHYML